MLTIMNFALWIVTQNALFFISCHLIIQNFLFLIHMLERGIELMIT